MTRHLSPEQLTAALEGFSTPADTDHLHACDACRGALAELETALRQVKSAAVVPEPSPLFWDHLSDRVREATRADGSGERASWWHGAWRPLTAAGAVMAVVALVIALRVSPGHDSGSSGLVAPGSDASVDIAATDEASWTAMAEMASVLSSDDVRQVVASAPDSGDGVTTLTPKEREAFVRLVKLEMGDVQ
jgi:anti-sigma-K factor RskA